MVEMLIDEAKEKGVTEISLDATEMGRPLYEALGFENNCAGMVLELRQELISLYIKSSIKAWEAPYEQELLTSEMKAKLIADVEKSNGPGKVNIKFC